MKKILSCLFAITMVMALCLPALAAEPDTAEPTPSYTILVADQVLDISDLPCAPYREGDTIMVPLRKISEALGYLVDWNAETGAITVDDDYIQKATLFDGTEKVVFEGKLQVIDMSREIENAVKTIIHNSYTYVPLEFFQEFFNNTAVEGNQITVAPSKAELQTLE